MKGRLIERCRPLPTPCFGKDIVGTAPNEMNRLSPLAKQIKMQSLPRTVAACIIIERNRERESSQPVIRLVRKPFERSDIGIVNTFANGRWKIRCATRD